MRGGRPSIRIASIAAAAALGSVLWAVWTGCAAPTPPPDVVEEVDLARYAGRWYEIASFPKWFQSGCVASRATYSLRADGRIDVRNECRDESFDGALRRAEGIAWVVDPEESNARLAVRFFWPFVGDYWILELDADYRFAAVGDPARDSLWILSRTPAMDPAEYEALLERLAGQDFDLSRLQRTPQPAAWSARGGTASWIAWAAATSPRA
ncbi:MAG: lipocalin family protein [Myxococcota bacterium]